MEPLREERGLFREAWDRTKRFILPEETVSLKVVFDNVRNYLMCAAVVAAVGALGPSNGRDGVLPWTLIIFAILLIGTNALQSWFIVERFTNRVGRFQKEVRPQWGKLKRRLMRLFHFALLVPVLAAMFQGFSILILWALAGGRQASGL